MGSHQKHMLFDSRKITEPNSHIISISECSVLEWPLIGVQYVYTYVTYYIHQSTGLSSAGSWKSSCLRDDLPSIYLEYMVTHRSTYNAWVRNHIFYYMPSIQNSVIHQIILTINGRDHDDFTEVELYPQVVHAYHICIHIW